MSDVVAGIFARGGSKGLPDKNIRSLHGTPLIGYAIRAARSCAHIDRVLVSTDDRRIAEVAREYGAEIPFMRPGCLAEDDSPEWLAWRHMLEELRDGGGRGGLPSAFVSVPPTSPLRAVRDLDRAIERFFESAPDAVITVREAVRNPYFNMVTVDDDGRARLVGRPGEPVHRRQDAPEVYDITTVAYVLQPAFVLESSSLFEGKVQAVPVPRERAVDIDDWVDWRLAEVLMEDRGV